MWFLKIPGVNNYEDYLAFWGSLANSVGLNLPMKEPINWSGRVQFTNLPGRVPKIWFERSQGRPAVCIRRQIKCEHVRSYLHILHDGDVVPCCNIPEVDGKKEILFGNMQLDTIMGIWDSSRYKSFKKNHSRRDIKVYSPAVSVRK